MESDFLASGNHFVPISQICLPFEAVFPSLGSIFQTNPSLQPVATDFLLISARENRFLQFVSETDSNGSNFLAQ